MENTSDYRRDNRRAEYGDERIPEMRSFLESISPLNNADRITSRLMDSMTFIAAISRAPTPRICSPRAVRYALRICNNTVPWSSIPCRCNWTACAFATCRRRPRA